MERKLFSGSATQSKALGLSKKATYEDLVAYIEKDPDRIKYPNRKAKIIRNSFELSQLDGLGQLEISRQHEITLLNQEAQVLLQRFAQDNDLPLADVQAYVGNLGLVPLHEHHARRILQMLGGDEGGGARPPPAGNNGVLGNGQVAVAGQPAAPPVPPPPLAQPVPVHVQNLGGVVFGPPPPMRIHDPGRTHRRDPISTPAGSYSGGHSSGSAIALNQLPRYDPSRREETRPSALQPGSFTFGLFDPQLNNPFSFITSDNLAHYIRGKQTTRFREIPHIHQDGRIVAATPLVPRKMPKTGVKNMTPPPSSNAPTYGAQAPQDSQPAPMGLLAPIFQSASNLLALTDAPTTVWIPRDMFTRALGRMGLRADIRGADEAAEGRAQMMALTDIQRQESARDQNVTAVSEVAQNDLAQASGSSSRPVRRSRFDRKHGWDPVQPGYAPIPLGMGYSPGSASSSLGLAPEPPVASDPPLAPAAASAILPSQTVSRTRLRAKTPPRMTVYSERS